MMPMTMNETTQQAIVQTSREKIVAGELWAGQCLRGYCIWSRAPHDARHIAGSVQEGGNCAGIW